MFNVFKWLILEKKDSLAYPSAFAWVNRTPILLLYALFEPLEIFWVETFVQLSKQ